MIKDKLTLTPHLDGVTIRVRMCDGLRWRMAIAGWLVHLAGRVAGCWVDVDID